MSFAMIVYLVGMLSPLKTTLIFFIVSSMAVGVLCFIVALLSEEALNQSMKYRKPEEEDDIKWHRTALKSTKICLFIFVICIFGNIIVPTEKTAYVMIAAYGVEDIVTDDRVQQLGGKSLDVIEAWLDEMALGEQGGVQ